MDLTSSSTLAEIKAAYRDNCGYDLNASSSECKAFIQAARMLLLLMAEEVEAGGGERIKDTYVKIEHELNKAETWLAANDPTATTRAQRFVRHADLRSYRS